MEKKKNEEGMMIHDEWESGLPSPDDLTPLTQSLITPQLASAFNIIITTPSSPLLDLNLNEEEEANSGTTTTTTTKDDGWSSHHRVGLGGVKRPRLVWTPQLHKRFVDVIEQLGIERAVPKTIMEMMNVDGLTRENVASHLQKYRLYLKRVEGGEGNGGNNGNKGLGLGSGGGGVGNGYNVEMKHSMAPLMHMGMFGANGAGVPGGNFGYGGYCGLESGAYN